jgi:hypothetical protein
MKIILDEQKIVDKALKEGFIDTKKPSSTIRLLIKHFYNIGQDKTQVRDSVETFLKKNLKGFNEIKWQNLLDNMVKDLEKNNNELFVLKDIKISNNELHKIRSIDNLRLEKLAFVLLVYAKIYNQMNNNDSNWVNAELKDIYSDTKMAISSTEQGKMIYKLKELGLVDVSKRVDCTNIKVLFVDDGEIEIELNDFRDFVLVYLKWIGERIGYCIECNKPIKLKPNANNQKYCNECFKKNRNEYQKELMNKKRNC